ncbi:MAG TPA: DUF438 domain-containing protein, partial [Firmicutes bacterium]|nr:DUF438 domain-containing protein [Bacillota bacterium]
KNREDGRGLYLKYQDDIAQVTPQEAFEVFSSLLEKGVEASEILVFLDKMINAFYKSLSAHRWEKPDDAVLLQLLCRENEALEQKIENIKQMLKDPGYFTDRKDELLQRLQELQEFSGHYEKKENILFPFLEKKDWKFAGLSIMWQLHSDIKAQLKKVISLLQAGCDEEEFIMEYAKLVFAMLGLVYKENLILFPAASEVLTGEEWQEMLEQSLEYPFPYIEKPDLAPGRRPAADRSAAVTTPEGLRLVTETGELDTEQLLLILNTLPVDITYVDENNKVRFFSRPKDRLFPRSPAVIGRSVENCHPPESVHVVTEIVEAFRSGKQDRARFWLAVKGRKVLIQYFALRNAEGQYKGVLEVSQDIGEIQELTGERRLLQWEND